MTPKVAIAGAGLLGRLLAWQLSHLGCEVHVFDPAPGPEPRTDGQGAAAWTSAGMLSPWAELENSGDAVFKRGLESIGLWQQITTKLSQNLGLNPAQLFSQNGSLLLAHASDAGSAMRVWSRLQHQAALHEADHAHEKTPGRSQVFSSPSGGLAQNDRSGGAAASPENNPAQLDSTALRQLEPALAPGLRGWYLPQEAQLTPHAVLQALLADARGVQWHWGQHVDSVEPGSLLLRAHGKDQNPRHNGQPNTFKADLAIDTRGLGARPALPLLRGVRGEIITLHAPGLTLTRPLRLLHPRHRVYIVPRSGEQIVVGASEIESEDQSPVSLRSAVELMAAAHSVLPELAEARIIHLETNLRPALPDNQAYIHIENGLVRINGLFRHGWLLGPSLVNQALREALI
jgi:glycine oxidase